MYADITRDNSAIRPCDVNWEPVCSLLVPPGVLEWDLMGWVCVWGFCVAAKDAQVLTVDKCLRLLQQQRQQTAARPAAASQPKGGWLVGALLRRLLKRKRSIRVGASLCCCSGTTDGAAAAREESSPEALEKALPHPAGCCSRCTPESTDEEQRAAPYFSSFLSVSPPTTPVFSLSHLPSLAPPAAVSRRACAAEGPGAGSTSSSTTTTTGCSSRSSDGEGQGAPVGGSHEGRQRGGGWNEGASEGSEALAAKEMKIRLRSVKRSLPLTAVWLSKSHVGSPFDWSPSLLRGSSL